MESQEFNHYHARGIAHLTPSFINEYIPFLQKQLANLYDKGKRVRPWYLWELHNPWGLSALKVDSWKFLDLCQSPELLALITPLIGTDIILYDSQFSPDLAEAERTNAVWRCDRMRCPVEPLAGVVVRILLSDSISNETKFVYQTDNNKAGKYQHIKTRSGQILCHDIKLNYRVTGIEKSAQPFEYVIRYFPATSLYLRDPTTKVHGELTELYPLLNYAQLPLWLVQGEDRANNDFVTGFQPKVGRWVGQ